MKASQEIPAVSSVRIALGAGLFTAVCLAVYFMILKFADLVQVTELRIVDFFILSIGMILAYRYYNTRTNGDIKYLQGLLFGVSVSAFASVPFALWMAVYFEWLDPQLLIRLKENSPLLGTYISPFKIFVTAIIGGMGWGMVLSFLLMQYYQSDAHLAKRK
jgi:hypothetical protein